EDFVKCFEDASGRDLSQFSLWYHQAGTPLVTASGAYDAAAATFTLSLEQMIPATPGQPDKQPAHIPLSFSLILDNGDAAAPAGIEGGEVTGDVLHLTGRSQTFTFTGISSRPVLSLNRSFSAPINLHFDQRAEDLAHIARHDSDLFARWQALTDLALPNLIQAARDSRDGRQVACSLPLIAAILEAAADERLEPAFRAQALALPGETDIARELGGNNDPDAIHAGRAAIMTAIAQAGQKIFVKLFEEMRGEGGFSPDAASAGRRALRNNALSYLAYGEQSPARAAEAFAAADNMTDMLQALTVLAHRFPASDEAAAGLDAFVGRFGDNPLV